MGKPLVGVSAHGRGWAEHRLAQSITVLTGAVAHSRPRRAAIGRTDYLAVGCPWGCAFMIRSRQEVGAVRSGGKWIDDIVLERGNVIILTSEPLELCAKAQAMAKIGPRAAGVPRAHVAEGASHIQRARPALIDHHGGDVYRRGKRKTSLGRVDQAEESVLLQDAKREVAGRRLTEGRFYQFRMAFADTQAKGAFKIMEDDVSDALEVDFVLPESAVKPGLKIPGGRI